MTRYLHQGAVKEAEKEGGHLPSDSQKCRFICRMLLQWYYRCIGISMCVCQCKCLYVFLLKTDIKMWVSASRFSFKLGSICPENTKSRIYVAAQGYQRVMCGECLCWHVVFLYHVQLLFLFSKLFISARLLRHSHLFVIERFPDYFLWSIYRKASSRQSSLYFAHTLLKHFIIPFQKKQKCNKV